MINDCGTCFWWEEKKRQSLPLCVTRCDCCCSRPCSVIWHWGFFCSAMHESANNRAPKNTREKAAVASPFSTERFKKQFLFKLVSKMFSFERQKTCEWFVWVIIGIWFNVLTHTYKVVPRMINMKQISVVFNAYYACANFIPPLQLILQNQFSFVHTWCSIEVAWQNAWCTLISAWKKYMNSHNSSRIFRASKLMMKNGPRFWTLER